MSLFISPSSPIFACLSSPVGHNIYHKAHLFASQTKQHTTQVRFDGIKLLSNPSWSVSRTTPIGFYGIHSFATESNYYLQSLLVVFHKMGTILRYWLSATESNHYPIPLGHFPGLLTRWSNCRCRGVPLGCHLRKRASEKIQSGGRVTSDN